MPGVSQAMLLLAVLAVLLSKASSTDYVPDVDFVPATAPAPGSSCGTVTTKTIVCLPGTLQDASCEYAITGNISIATAQPCPSKELYDQSCGVLPGLLIIAFGPCNEPLLQVSNKVAAPTVQGPTRNVTQWLDILGLRNVTSVGGFLVRGYAYQTGPAPTSITNVNLLPRLQKVGDISPITLDNARLSPMTIAGAPVPPLGNVVTLEGGMLIENTPNVNFSDLFTSLQHINGEVIIVGNGALTSLDGLQGIESDVLGNLLIFSNFQLSNISALTNAARCSADGSTAVEPPDTSVGAITVNIASSSPTQCLLSTAQQVCDYIAKPHTCPLGTVTFENPSDAASPPIVLGPSGSADAPAPLL